MIGVIRPLNINKTRRLRRYPKVLPWDQARTVSIKIIEILVILEDILIRIRKSLMSQNSTAAIDNALASKLILIARLGYHLKMLLTLLLFTICIRIYYLLTVFLY